MLGRSSLACRYVDGVVDVHRYFVPEFKEKPGRERARGVGGSCHCGSTLGSFEDTCRVGAFSVCTTGRKQTLTLLRLQSIGVTGASTKQGLPGTARAGLKCHLQQGQRELRSSQGSTHFQ